MTVTEIIPAIEQWHHLLSVTYKILGTWFLLHQV